MTTSITSFLQALRIVPTPEQQKKVQQPPLKVLTAQKASVPIITLDAVAHHDDYFDCWVVIYDRVYDVTSFIQDHPGGADVIMDYAGRDATLAFHGTGHSRDAIEQMRDYFIGELPENEKIFRCTTGQVIKTGIPDFTSNLYKLPSLSMDIVIREEDISLGQVAIYASLSFLVVSVLGLGFFATCSKKYRLNWFEKNLLESVNTKDGEADCRDSLVATASGYNVDNISECSRSVGKGNITPTSINTDDPTFWVPPPSKTIQQQVSTDESPPSTPTSPTGSLKSNTLSLWSCNSVPIARSDKHVVLAMNPTRPKVSSMNAKLDHTKIDMALYRTNSLQKGANQPNDIKGSLNISIVYDPHAGILSVRLIEAQNLQPRDFSGTADPYAKIRLLPEKKNFWQTRIHKKTLNPVFDEDFVFEEHPNAIDKRIIEVLLYDFDAYSRHVCIGGAQIPLATLDLTKKEKFWTPLGTCAEQDMKVDLGDVMVTLAYLPSAERLTVVVIKARNLRIIDDSRNTSDPYIKVTLLLPGKKNKKRKTAVIRNNINPVYNEALTFDVNKEALKNATIEVTVVHDGLLGSNEILGRAVIGSGPDVRPEEKIFFEEMFRCKNATAQWVALQDVNTSRNGN